MLVPNLIYCIVPKRRIGFFVDICQLKIPVGNALYFNLNLSSLYITIHNQKSDAFFEKIISRYDVWRTGYDALNLSKNEKKCIISLKILIGGRSMESKTAVGFVTAEKLELLRTVSSGIRGIVTIYKANNLVYREKVRALEERLEYELSRQRMEDIKDLTTIAFQQSIDLLHKINSSDLSETERKYYMKMLEKQDERMNNIIDNFTRKFL